MLTDYSSYDDPSAQGAPRPQRPKKKPKTDQEADTESSTTKNQHSENSTPEAQTSSSIVIEEYALNASDDDFVMSHPSASWNYQKILLYSGITSTEVYIMDGREVMLV